MRPTRNALFAALEPASRTLLEAAEDAARALDVGLWLVGGGVRDLAIRRPLHDLDLAFAGDPTAFVDAVAVRCPEVSVERTDRFGTATIASDGARLDLARLRSERYVVPGALPEVRATRSIEADLARRDFSVNAIALELAPEVDRLIDPYGGIEDLRAGRLRVLHDRSFVDDATRLWRGARTAALFDLEPDATTARLIAEGTRWTEEITGTRLWAELAYTARRGRALGTLERLDAWGVLRSVHPALCLSPVSADALARRHPMPVERLAAALLAPLEARDAILERFQAPGSAREVVQDTARLLAAETTPGALATVEGVGDEARIAARWLQPARQAEIQRDLRRWERTRPWLNAEQLMALGVPRGPELGRALRGLRRGRYLGTLSTTADARRLARRVLAGEAQWDADEALD